MLRGDSVLVTCPDRGTTKFEGIVADIDRDFLYLKFSKYFQYISGPAYDVEFVLSRSVLRGIHQGVKLAQKLLDHPVGRNLLLPAVQSESEVLLTDIFPVNRSLNKRQLLAVKYIANRAFMSTAIPYLIFGPPGTGKTSTLVEAIKQYGILQTDKKFLVCAVWR